MSCDVKFYFFTPTFNSDGIPSTKNIAILCYGEHTHPPPPPRKIPQNVKDNLIRVVQAFGAAEATARKIIASPLLPIVFNGKTTLAEEHIALTNHSAVNHIIRRERLRRHPLGTGFEGARHLMIQRGPENPYIRQCYQFPDGHFVILCQLKAQSHLLFRSLEIQADKTFARTDCKEFEFNSFDHATRRSTTLARVFTDYEDEWGYYHAFNLVFTTAEQDVGRKIPWGHMTPPAPSVSRVKAVLVDMHGGQIKGLGRYFQTEYRHEGDAIWHVVRIVKVCQVHFERSIKALEKKGVDAGN